MFAEFLKKPGLAAPSFLALNPPPLGPNTLLFFPPPNITPAPVSAGLKLLPDFGVTAGPLLQSDLLLACA